MTLKLLQILLLLPVQIDSFDDLVQFCATPAGLDSSILTVDPTFCLGEFECTPITYRPLILVSKRSGAPPVFLGPVLIHYRKNFASFLFFASSLVGLRRSLEGIRVFGTDGVRHWLMPSVMNFDLLFICIVSIMYVTI